MPRKSTKVPRPSFVREGLGPRLVVVCVCVCQCVQAAHPLLTQLQDKVDIPTDSVSCSLQNKFGVFRIITSCLPSHSASTDGMI